MKEPLILLNSWGGAQYLDWWFLVHLLAGVCLALALRLYDVSFTNSIFIVGAILVGWEVYEKLAHIQEPWTNTIIDLVVGTFGVWLAYKISLFENANLNFLLLLLILVIWTGLGAWGWVSWKMKHESPFLETQQYKKGT